MGKLAPLLLEDATELVQSFLLSQISPEGGMKNRAGQSDLYYSFFGLECMIMLDMEIDYDQWSSYLISFDDDSEKDLIHFSSLVRCWANLPENYISEERRSYFAQSLKQYSSADGSYNTIAGSEKGTAYGCFVALDTLRNLGLGIHQRDVFTQALLRVQTPCGSFAIDEGMTSGTVPTTCAALVALNVLGYPLEKMAASYEWLNKQRCPQGGFWAFAGAPLQDLLSTATALHTLSSYEVETWENAEIFQAHDELTLDFIDSLWVNKGSFYAHWSDEQLDVEYLFYALLALGHLAQKKSS
ncbi:MAG: hypothetical protein HQL32_11580 [Planctomycetes bacterium]|nr:hypothetical protein [Planctomycetota bacterium]